MMPTCKHCGQDLLGDIGAGVDLDLNLLRVVVNRPVQPRCAELLYILARNTPGYVTDGRLLSQMYGSKGWPQSDGALRTFIAQGRRSLQETGVVIQNTYSEGYRLNRDF